MNMKLEPHAGLWTLAARFYEKYATWMTGPFSKLNPEDVESEVSDAARKIYKLSKVSPDSVVLLPSGTAAFSAWHPTSSVCVLCAVCNLRSLSYVNQSVTPTMRQGLKSC